MLEFNTALEKDVLVIELEGSLDSQSAADFRGWFQEKIAAGYRAFAIDCLCLEYISSAGISSLIDLQAHVANQSGKIVLYQLSGETRQLLRFLGLENKMHFANDYDEAIAALTGYKKIEKAEAPEMVEMAELRVVPEAAAEQASAPKAEPVAGAAQPAAESNELLVEENITGAGRGLQPLNDNAANAPAPAATTSAVASATETPGVLEQSSAEPPKPTAPPEAHEIKVNTGAKRLITCPNCKSVLRVALGGDYLCPACRFRFTYKGSA